jgi:hypothetical protein
MIGIGEKPMNEMKPEDVMRALELCKSFRDLHACDVCPYFRAELADDESCTNRMVQDALALLREKDADIEVLGAELSRYTENVARMVETARSEAITELAEKIKCFYNNLPGKTVGGSVAYHVDQIVKEMREKYGCVCTENA